MHEPGWRARARSLSRAALLRGMGAQSPQVSPGNGGSTGNRRPWGVGEAHCKSAGSVKLGRLWAVEGWPPATNNDH